jgi:hypothetical protein
MVRGRLQRFPDRAPELHCCRSAKLFFSRENFFKGFLKYGLIATITLFVQSAAASSVHFGNSGFYAAITVFLVFAVQHQASSSFTPGWKNA